MGSLRWRALEGGIPLQRPDCFPPQTDLKPLLGGDNGANAGSPSTAAPSASCPSPLPRVLHLVQVAGSVLCGVATWGVRYQAQLKDAVPPAGVNPLLSAGVFLLFMSFLGFVGSLFDTKVGGEAHGGSHVNHPYLHPPATTNFGVPSVHLHGADR